MHHPRADFLGKRAVLPKTAVVAGTTQMLPRPAVAYLVICFKHALHNCYVVFVFCFVYDE